MRPGLATALKEARAMRCPLSVSRLDRLSRNVLFVTGLMEHKVHISGAYGSLRTSLCAQPFFTLLLVENKRLIALGTAELNPRIVYSQCLAVGGYNTMDVANDFAIFLEIKVPCVRIQLFRMRRIRSPRRGLLFVLAVAVPHPV
jgi:hypothetical protein